MAEIKLDGMYDELMTIMMIKGKRERVVRYLEWVKFNKGDSI